MVLLFMIDLVNGVVPLLIQRHRKPRESARVQQLLLQQRHVSVRLGKAGTVCVCCVYVYVYERTRTLWYIGACAPAPSLTDRAGSHQARMGLLGVHACGVFVVVVVAVADVWGGCVAGPRGALGGAWGGAWVARGLSTPRGARRSLFYFFSLLSSYCLNIFCVLWYSKVNCSADTRGGTK